MDNFKVKASIFFNSLFIKLKNIKMKFCGIGHLINYWTIILSSNEWIIL